LGIFYQPLTPILAACTWPVSKSRRSPTGLDRQSVSDMAEVLAEVLDDPQEEVEVGLLEFLPSEMLVWFKTPGS
jgi:hypothetical protein